MALETSALRKLVSLDPSDALSRFALGKRLFETGEFDEAVAHLSFANSADPSHLATYHLLAQALMKLNRFAEARPVLVAGMERVAGVGHGMGRDLGPAMDALLSQCAVAT